LKLLKKTEEFWHLDNGDFQMLELPYRGGRASMVIFLPKKKDGLVALERSLTPGQLVEWLEKIGCTTILISESEETISTYSRHGIMEFLVDGVIILYNIQKGSIRENAIEVLKMRGTAHQKKIVPFKIDDGVRVFPLERTYIRSTTAASFLTVVTENLDCMFCEAKSKSAVAVSCEENSGL